MAAVTDRERLSIEIDARWRSATVDVRRFANEAYPSEVNSKRMERLADTIEELGFRLIADPIEADGDSLEQVKARLLAEIEHRLKEWADAVEMARLERKEGKAA